MLVVLLQLIEKNSPAKAPSPKTILRMRAAETSPPSIPVSVSSFQAGHRLHAGHPDLPALQLSPEPAFAFAGSLLSKGREPEVAVWEASSDGAPQVQKAATSRPAGLRGRGGGGCLERGRGRRCGTTRDLVTLSLACPGPRLILWARFFESDAPEKAFCAARLSGSGGSNCSPGSLTRDAGEDSRFSPLLASASGGVNPAQDAAAGDRDARVPVLDYSNKLEN